MYISVTYSHQLEDPTAKESHSYSFGQLNDPVYNDVSFTVGSLDVDAGLACAVSDQVTKGYVCIEHLTKPQTELTSPTVNNESIDNDFYDVNQHTYKMVKANMKKNANEKGDQNMSKFTVQENSHYSTPVRDDASQKGDDFYDGKEHVYSVVNTKFKKRANQETEEGGEGDWKDHYRLNH